MVRVILSLAGLAFGADSAWGQVTVIRPGLEPSFIYRGPDDHYTIIEPGRQPRFLDPIPGGRGYIENDPGRGITIIITPDDRDDDE